MSPAFTGLQLDLLKECYNHTEFRHLSMDATIRILRRVPGQADYRSSAEIRSAAPIPDHEAKRRVLTVLGRTSAVLGMIVVGDESSTAIADALTKDICLPDQLCPFVRINESPVVTSHVYTQSGRRHQLKHSDCGDSDLVTPRAAGTMDIDLFNLSNAC